MRKVPAERPYTGYQEDAQFAAHRPSLAILDEHGPRLFALLVRLTLRTDVAEDLMQDLFCRLTQDMRCLNARDPAAYAIRVGVNLALDHRRARRRGRESGVLTPDSAVSTHSPLSDLLHREQLEQVLDAVSQLAPESQEVIVLRFLERQDYKKIGHHLDKSPHHVRALCHKAVLKLRTILGAEHPQRITRP